jgi:hypothetical protein
VFLPWTQLSVLRASERTAGVTPRRILPQKRRRFEEIKFPFSPASTHTVERNLPAEQLITVTINDNVAL